MQAFNKQFEKLGKRVNEELYYLGYSKLENIGRENLLALNKDTEEILPEIMDFDSKGEFFAMIDTSLALFKKSFDIVNTNVVPQVKNYFDLNEVDVHGASHLIKPFGKGGVFAAHQDSSIVEEPENFALNAWVPLTNVTRLNGCLWVLPGSHIFPNYLRHANNKPLNNPVAQKEIWKRMVPITCRAGDIFLFHRSLIHGSSGNYLPWQKYRIAVECVIVPKNAQFIVYHRPSNSTDNEIVKFKVSKEHFFENENPREKLLEDMKNYEVVQAISNEEISLQLRDFFQKFKERSLGINPR